MPLSGREIMINIAIAAPAHPAANLSGMRPVCTTPSERPGTTLTF